MPSLRIDSLRARLREATAPLHQRLDQAVGSLDLGDPAQYAQFLQIQLAARAPIESWAERHCPADLLPPETAPLLLEDLRALGVTSSRAFRHFALPEGAQPIGLAWALGGSHLGNRVLRRSVPAGLPTAFLDDQAMSAFWRTLGPRLEVPCSEEQASLAVVAAAAVFRHFLAVEQAAGARGLAA